MKAYPSIESLDRSIKSVVIITIYGGWKNPSYRWYRPNIDAIIEEGNIDLLNQLFSQDVARNNRRATKRRAILCLEPVDRAAFHSVMPR